ncbi:hypothetical protein [Caballeronia sordidicola]|uniref:Uncharacterized protein n=1 Tax=Caballeronia sordidicola TaxID=196367 RepID=A0A226X5E5_CABSO|nr:hypothetical protein [Caballeronia sordidicola]OXC78654.1 hypothetical protein BSU04_11020 [Caballeronia sordidicola]
MLRIEVKKDMRQIRQEKTPLLDIDAEKKTAIADAKKGRKVNPLVAPRKR